MVTVTRRTAAVFTVAGLLLIPRVASAQAASVTGLVKDSTGAILPGVTVEVTSPALIERVRGVITNETGLYRIVDLRPGIYTVTFALTGFSTVKREGIELSAGFTATVNADLRVGEIEETVTVSGSSPIVDVQNVAQQRAVTRDVLDAIPTGSHISTVAALVPGMSIVGGITGGSISQDVGGMAGANQAVAVMHGSRVNDGMNQVDGMSVNSLTRIGSTRMLIQEGNVQEIIIGYAAHSAELETGGVRINVIPREGANRFTGSFYGSFANEGLQSDNYTDDLAARGLRAPNRLKRLYDVNPNLGGPIKRDKLWFFASYRRLIDDAWVAGMYTNTTPRSWFRSPDLTQQAIEDQVAWNSALRLTWQVSSKNKINAYADYNYTCLCHFNGGSNPVSPEATTHRRLQTPVYQVSWTSPITSRVLLEAGYSQHPPKSDNENQKEVEGAEGSITEQSTTLRYRGGSFSFQPARNTSVRASMSYVTGAHVLKVGLTSMLGTAWDYIHGATGDNSFRVSRPLNEGGVPNQVTYSATPYNFNLRIHPVAFFVQDQTTLKRLTLNAGLRLDTFNSSYDAVHLEPVRWLPVARDFAGAEVLNWKDLNPRLGVSYDPFGTGKTAIKASLNRYILQEGRELTAAVHPVNSSNNSIARTWTDVNRDFVVQGDPFNSVANGELGPSPNVRFGFPTTTLRYDTRANGFGKRPYQWETSIGIQRELLDRVSVNVSYFRRSFGNFFVTDNLAVNPSDADPYCITAPVDSRLPGGGGHQICGLFDITPAKFGQIDNLQTRASDYGRQTETRQDIDLTMNLRFANGALLQGGVSTGSSLTDTCDVVGEVDRQVVPGPSSVKVFFTPDAAPSTRFCRADVPFKTQLKLLGAYTLPWDMQISGTLQSIPGDLVSASYVATNAQIFPSLQRTLSSGTGGTANINLIAPGAMYLERINQVDLRVSKTVTVGKTRIEGLFNVYNFFNANPVLVANYTYASAATWLTPLAILQGRLIKLGVQMRF